jgi:hypothetical protein
MHPACTDSCMWTASCWEGLTAQIGRQRYLFESGKLSKAFDNSNLGGRQHSKATAGSCGARRHDMSGHPGSRSGEINSLPAVASRAKLQANILLYVFKHNVVT